MNRSTDHTPHDNSSTPEDIIDEDEIADAQLNPPEEGPTALIDPEESVIDPHAD
jgi:hypothetical protein